MTNNSENTQDGKPEKEALVAEKKIKSINVSIRWFNIRLKTINKQLNDNIRDYPIIKVIDIDNIKRDKEGYDYPLIFKKRNNIENLPERIWFKMHGILYYIEFTVRHVKHGESSQFEGCIIYGTSYYNEKGKVEDKPIVTFFIDNNGIIKSPGEFEKESWTCEKDHIIDLHLRTLDKIWEEGLFQINKDKFS